MPIIFGCSASVFELTRAFASVPFALIDMDLLDALGLSMIAHLLFQGFSGVGKLSSIKSRVSSIVLCGAPLLVADPTRKLKRCNKTPQRELEDSRPEHRAGRRHDLEVILKVVLQVEWLQPKPRGFGGVHCGYFMPSFGDEAL